MRQYLRAHPAAMGIGTAESDDLRATLQRAIPEMEKAVADLTAQTAKAIAKERALFRDLERSRSECEQWRERAVEAVEAGDIETLHKALARKNECQRTVAELDSECEVVCQTNSALQRKLGAMGARLAESRQRLAALSGQKGVAASGRYNESQARGPISGDGRLGLGSSEGSSGDSGWRAPVER
jgi:phage shock protein A